MMLVIPAAASVWMTAVLLIGWRQQGASVLRLLVPAGPVPG